MRRPPRQRIVRLATLAALVRRARSWGGRQGGAHPPTPLGPGGHRIGGPMHSWLPPAARHLSQPGRAAPRAVLYHELGHTFDLEVLHPKHRRKFKRLRGSAREARPRPRPSGLPTPTPSERNGGACVVLGRRGRGFWATPARHRRVCAPIRDAAAPDRRDKRGPPADAPKVDEPHTSPPSGSPGQKRPPSGPPSRRWATRRPTRCPAATWSSSC